MVLHCALAIICVWLGNVEIVILSGIVLVYSLVCNKKVFEYVWCFVVLLHVNKFGSVEFVYVLHFEYFQFFVEWDRWC